MKKKERKYQSLEDIEQDLKQKLNVSPGADRVRKQNAKKTAYFGNPVLQDFLSEYGRLLVIPAVSVGLILLILILQAFLPGTGGGVSASAETEAAGSAAAGTDTPETADAQQANASDTENASQNASQETEEPEEAEPEGPILCRIPQIEQTVNDYFTARLKADTDTLYRLYGRSGDTGKDELAKKLRAQASWIQSYDGIRVYTMPGMDDDSKVCVITYKINFRRTNTNAPGIMYCYMMKQADGSWQIGENLKNDKVRYIDQKLQDPEVVKMQNEVDAELRNALNSDSTLSLIYTSFLNGEIYNETAPDINTEQEVDFLNNPADSDLAGGLVIENNGEETETSGEPAAEGAGEQADGETGSPEAETETAPAATETETDPAGTETGQEN